MEEIKSSIFALGRRFPADIYTRVIRLQPVTEANIDGLLYQVECMAELYAKAGNVEDAISERWTKAAVLRNLPKQITIDMAMQFKDQI